MLYQTDKQLPEVINIFGCYFMSIGYIAELTTKKKFQAVEIIAIYIAAVATGIIKKEVRDEKGNLTDGCFINDPLSLLALWGGAKSEVTKEDAKYQERNNEQACYVYHRPANTPVGMENRVHTHFVVGENGMVLFDPMGKSNTVKYGFLKSKRIFR